MNSYKPWLEGVIEYTFGAGIGLAILLWLLMLCCSLLNCCRGQNSIDKAPDGIYSGFRKQLSKLDSKSDGTDSRSRSRSNNRVLLMGLVALFCSHILLAGMVYYEADLSRGHLNNFRTGTDNLLLDFADGLCSNDKKDAAYSTCSDSSLGHFLYEAKSLVNSTFDAASEWLGSLDYIMTNVSAVNTSLLEMEATLNELNEYLTWFSGNDTQVYTILTAMLNPDNVGGVDFAFSTSSLPSSDQVNADLAVVQDAASSMSSSLADVNSIMSDVTRVLNEQVVTVQEDLSANGTARKSVDNVLETLLDDVRKFNNDILDGKNTADSVDIDSYVQELDDGITLVFFLPSLSLLFYGCITWRTKSGTPMRCSMLTVFFCQQWCSLLAGLVMLISVILSDFCTYHLTVLETNANTSVTVGSTTVNIAKSIDSLLHCSGDANFISILGLTNEFNITEQVNSVISGVDSSMNTFTTQMDYINGILGTSRGLVSNITNLTIAGDVSSLISEIKAIEYALPASPMNRENTTQQVQLYSIYSHHTSGADFYFNWLPTGTYYTELASVNSHLRLMSYMPAGYGYPQNFTSILDLNASVLADTHGPWYDGNADGIADNRDSLGDFADYGSTTYNLVKAAVFLCGNTTSNVTDAINMNDHVRYNLSIVIEGLQNLEALSTQLTDSETQLPVDFDNLNASTLHLIDTVDWSVSGLDNILTMIKDFIDYVLTGPGYLECAYLGTFYSQSIEGYLCTDIKYDMGVFWIPMLICVVLLLVTFCFVGYHTPHMKIPGKGCCQCCGCCSKPDKNTNITPANEVIVASRSAGIDAAHDPYGSYGDEEQVYTRGQE
jgi:hypothetical protein